MSALTTVIVRRARAEDLTAIGKLGALLVRTHHDFDAKRFIPATGDTESGYAWFLGTQLDKPKIIVLAAEKEGDVIGYTYSGVEGRDYMSLRGPAGVLYDIVVDTQHRNQGVGRALLNATLEALKSSGASQVVLSTAEKNEPAQRLFAGAGFRRTMIEMTRDVTD